MRPGLLFVVCLCLLVLQGCTFSPHHEFVNPIVPPSLDGIIVEVNDPNFTSPYYYQGPAYFYFSLKGTNSPISTAEVRFNGFLITSTVHDSFLTFVLPDNVAAGTHTVSIRVLAETQSGSLLSKLGGELFDINRSFQVIVDPVPPPDINPATAYENGYLTLRWTKTNKKNFRYKIKRYNSNGLQFLNDSIIYNTALDNFVDKGYVGGNMTYTITASGYPFEKDLATVQVNDTPEMTVTTENSKLIRVSWTTPNLEPSQMTLKFNHRGKDFNVPFATSGSRIIDTVVMAEYPSQISMNLSRAGYSRQRIYLAKDLVLAPSNFQSKYIDHVMLSKHNKVLVMTETDVHRYSLPDFVLEETLNRSELGGTSFLKSMAVSYDQDRVVVANYNKLFSFDAATFDNLVSYDDFSNVVSSATGNSNEIYDIQVTSLSNDGLATMNVTKAFSSGAYPLAYNININSIDWNGSPVLASNLSPPVTSHDGSHIVSDNSFTLTGDVFRKVGGNYEKIGVVPRGRKYFRNNSYELVVLESRDPNSQQATLTAAIYNLAVPPATPDLMYATARSKTLAIIPNQSVDRGLISLDYDVTSDRVTARYFVQTFSAIWTYDAVTWAVKGPYKCEYFNFDSGHDFANGYQFTSGGYIQKVE